MTEERRHKIEQVYRAALEHDTAARSAYVAEACGPDAELRKEVESLLAQDAGAASDWRAGARLGPYEIEGKLGAGGMGEVWKARDTRLGRLVALKVSKLGFSQRFEREARAVAALNHPHICTLYDIGPNYLVMEYVEGKTLRDLIPRRGMPLHEALQYAAQIADALATAHAAGIVHRDLKPGNVMVTASGSVKVVDFGLARVTVPEARGPDDPTVTESVEGTIAGTISYMSPEQAQGRAVDARSDIFSFGALLYEMLTGARAFHGESATSTLADIIHKEPRPASEIAGELPREVEALLARCLRKDPARRAQSMADVKVALLDLKEDSDSGRLSTTAAVARTRRPNLRWLAGGGAAIVLAAGGWYLWPRHAAGVAMVPAVPLTSYPGNQTQPAFSPDGNQVAFAWDGPRRDNFDIYVKLVGEGEPLRLTSDPASEFAPAWSPDGRWIAFARALPEGRYALMLISPLGGAQRKLGEFGSPEQTLGFAWSRDSKRLALPIDEQPSHRRGLFVLSLDSGELRRLTTPDTESATDTLPRLSPDGQLLSFCRFRGQDDRDLYVMSVGPDLSSQGTPQRVLPAKEMGHAWTADSKELIVSYVEGFPVMTLRRIGLSGGPPQPLPFTGDGTAAPAISYPTGGGPSRLVWSHRFLDANIYRLELSGKPGEEKAGNAQAFIASVFRDLAPHYSPDGTHVVFSSARSGWPEIWICRADGSEARQLTNLGPANTSSPQWSPDGKQIAFDSSKEGPWEVYVVNAEGGAPKRLTDPPAANYAPHWSPDGRWVYFSSDRGASQSIWKMAPAGGPAQQVAPRGFGAAVSPDGRFLYYAKRIGPILSSLWRAPLDGGAETQVVPLMQRYSFAVTEQGIYYSVPQNRNSAGTIEFLDPATGRHALLWRTDKRLDLGMTVSPDGRYLLYPQVDFEGANLMMIENFR